MLFRLSAAEGGFLGDTELVEKLETTKSMAAEIERKARGRVLLFLLVASNMQSLTTNGKPKVGGGGKCTIIPC